MKKLVFATGNPNKLREVIQMIGDQYEILGLQDIGCHEDIPEPHPTLEANALQKAQYVKDNYLLDCFSEDTGFEVDQLNGDPGVFSARYAGPEKDADANIRKVLSEMEGKSNRNCRFRTIVALLLDGKEYFFEGMIEGKLLEDKRGEGGFGYDPVFLPDGYDQTFAEMDDMVKNRISHRGRAIRKLQEFLIAYTSTQE